MHVLLGATCVVDELHATFVKVTPVNQATGEKLMRVVRKMVTACQTYEQQQTGQYQKVYIHKQQVGLHERQCALQDRS